MILQNHLRFGKSPRFMTSYVIRICRYYVHVKFPSLELSQIIFLLLKHENLHEIIPEVTFNFFHFWFPRNIFIWKIYLSKIWRGTLNKYFVCSLIENLGKNR